MNSLPKQAILGAAAAALAVVAVAASGALPLIVALASAGVLAALAHVAFTAQSRRLQDERRLVYRPVYARRQAVQRRVRSDD